MTERRLSTVYDYSDLRLHPDGTCVRQISSNLKPRLAKITVQTARDNWIARDAGGSGYIPKHRKRKKVIQEDEEIPLDSEVERDDVQDSGEASLTSTNNLKRKPKRFDGRKAKKQKFGEDFDFLGASSLSQELFDSSPLAEVDSTRSLLLEKPSADLLKCIHRFASEYYTERGQLLNISRQYRKERKEKARRRQKGKDKDETGGEPDSPTSSSESDSESDSPSKSKANLEEENKRGVDKDSEGNSNDEYKPELDSLTKVKGKVKKKVKKRITRRREKPKLYMDMYKMFDGTVLMALGMLLEEYVSFLLTTQPSEAWVEEMQRGCVGDNPDGEAFQDDDEAENDFDKAENYDDNMEDNAERGAINDGFDESDANEMDVSGESGNDEDGEEFDIVDDGQNDDDIEESDTNRSSNSEDDMCVASDSASGNQSEERKIAILLKETNDFDNDSQRAISEKSDSPTSHDGLDSGDESMLKG